MATVRGRLNRLLVHAKASSTLGVVAVRLEVYTVRFVRRRVATFCSAFMQRLNALNPSADCAHPSPSQMYARCEVSQNFLCRDLKPCARNVDKCNYILCKSRRDCHS